MVCATSSVATPSTRSSRSTSKTSTNRGLQSLRLGREDRLGAPTPLRRSVLFVCRHGSAKSVLGAADFRTLAAGRGLEIEAVAAGLEPDAQIAPLLIEALPSQSLLAAATTITLALVFVMVVKPTLF